MFPRQLLAALVACICAVPTMAAAQAPASFSSVQVDTRGLAYAVGPGFAQRIQHIAVPVAQHVFGDRISGQGPVLVLRIDDLKLGPMTGEKGGGSDYVRGAALIVSHGRVIADYPLRGAPQSVAGTWTLPDVEDQQRLTGVVQFFAGWSRRNLGL